jgi:hypothetical protein
MSRKGVSAKGIESEPGQDTCTVCLAGFLVASPLAEYCRYCYESRISIKPSFLFPLLLFLYLLQQGTSYQNPCFEHIEKIMNALETADYKIRPLYKFVKAAEDCYAEADVEEKKKGKASTAYYLTKYLDRHKFKKK